METVLVIDDSSFQRKWLTQAIESLGYEVVQAENGKVGLEKATQINPTFITVDLNMPVMDGLQFLANLHPSEKNIPTIVITSDIQADTKRQCKELGAIAFLNKPFEITALQEVIKTFSSDRSVESSS